MADLDPHAESMLNMLKQLSGAKYEQPKPKPKIYRTAPLPAELIPEVLDYVDKAPEPDTVAHAVQQAKIWFKMVSAAIPDIVAQIHKLDLTLEMDDNKFLLHVLTARPIELPDHLELIFANSESFKPVEEIANNPAYGEARRQYELLQYARRITITPTGFLQVKFVHNAMVIHDDPSFNDRLADAAAEAMKPVLN